VKQRVITTEFGYAGLLKQSVITTEFNYVGLLPLVGAI
jgi:hypothetical protein